MRLTIFGASGLLGRELVRAVKATRGAQLTALSSKDADLRDDFRVERVVGDSRPDWIILAAAFTDVDGCEANRDVAWAVNCEGAVNVAQAARKVGSRLMFLSTDYVFDGTKGSPYEIGDPRNPINVYGESKARAEERLLEIVPEVCIVRTSWLFGHGGKCFPAPATPARSRAGCNSSPRSPHTANSPAAPHPGIGSVRDVPGRSEEHTSELQSL